MDNSMVEGKSVVLQEDCGIGSVQIADDVVAVIAALAATEVSGVYLVGNVTKEMIVKTGRKGIAKCVKVDVISKNVKVDLIVTVEFDSNIPAVSQKLQAKVKAAVENMTGLNCSDVNVCIAGVNTKKGR